MPKGIYDHSNRKNKKEEILKAAMKVYGFYGFEGATMERMAAAAGVSKALILKYFGSKQELVKEMASAAVYENLNKIKYIDERQGLTLRQREELVFSMIKPAREEWCLIIGTLLVPNFQFQMRSEIEGFIHSEYKGALKHLEEFKDPSKDTVFVFAYTMASLQMGYIVDGREENFRKAADSLMNCYLKPE